MPARLSETAQTEWANVVRRYPQRSGALLPLLHLMQEESGYLSPHAIEFVAGQLGLPPAQVLGVATFYPAFRLEPKPNHLIRVCGTLSCRLMGAGTVAEYLREKLAKEGTSDVRIEVEEVDCLACCGTAPVMMVDEELHQNLTFTQIDQIVERLRLAAGGDADV